MVNGDLFSKPDPDKPSAKKQAWTHDNVDNASVDWYTPPHIFKDTDTHGKGLNLQFDLDPCAPTGGVEWIPATHHYDIYTDGLISSWGDKNTRVWLNPPYGKFTSRWLEKMHHHRNGVALVFARTDCNWFHDYVTAADAILFIKQRIRFVDGLGKTGGNGAGAGSMLIAWGNDNVEALVRMSARGWFVDNRKVKK